MYGAIKRARDKAWKRANAAFRQAKRLGDMNAAKQGDSLMNQAARLNTRLRQEG